ncbi:MAG: hypothetical protein ABR936_12255 [Bacteroidota bacterium]|jgi:hypothetical protein
MKMPALYYATFVVESGVCTFGICRFKKLSKALQVLVGLILVWLIAEIIEYLTNQRNINNVWIAHINNVIEMVFFIMIYYFWRTSEHNGKILLSSLIIFITIWIVGKFTFEPFSGADETTWALSRLIQICVGVNFLLALLKKEMMIPILKNPKLITTSAFIIYSTGTFFLFSLFTPLLNVSIELTRRFYYINWILIIITQLLYARAIWCSGTTSDLQNQ